MKIVLSYRRSDAPGMAGWIYDCLRQHYGDESVFRDVDSIPFGVDFRKHIRTELDQCDALIAIIGPRWLGEGDHQRIHDQNDFVRFEIETALQRGIPVVPLLVEGATMPRPDQLPETLRDLAFYNAAEVDSGRDFRVHTQRLIESLDHLFAVARVVPGEAHQKAGPERLARKQEAGPQSEQGPRAFPRRTAPRPQEAVASDEAKIAPVLSISQQSAPPRDQDQNRVATTGNQAVPGTAPSPPQNKRRLRWAAAVLGLMALAAGGVYLMPKWQETAHFEVYGAINDKWQAMGGPSSPLGAPRSDEAAAARGGRFNNFQYGFIYWHPGSGAHAVYGLIGEKWNALGRENGTCGYPTSDEYDVEGGRRNDFERGFIVWQRGQGSAQAQCGSTPLAHPTAIPAAN